MKLANFHITQETGMRQQYAGELFPMVREGGRRKPPFSPCATTAAPAAATSLESKGRGIWEGGADGESESVCIGLEKLSKLSQSGGSGDTIISKLRRYGNEH